MKTHWKGFVSGFVSALLVLCFAVPAFAAYQKQVTLNYDNIKITVDGKQVVPTDANGQTVEPFIIDGTTYLPVRAIGNALGMSVYWDNITKTAVLTNTNQNNGNSSSSNSESTVRLLGFYKILSEGAVYLNDTFGVLSTQTGVSQALSSNNISGKPAAIGFRQNILDCKALIDNHYSGCKEYLTPSEKQILDTYLNLYPRAVKYLEDIQADSGSINFEQVRNDRITARALATASDNQFWSVYQGFSN